VSRTCRQKASAISSADQESVGIGAMNDVLMTITFDGISIAASGMNAYQTWLDAIADNIANINTITATDEEPF